MELRPGLHDLLAASQQTAMRCINRRKQRQQRNPKENVTIRENSTRELPKINVEVDHEMDALSLSGEYNGITRKEDADPLLSVKATQSVAPLLLQHRRRSISSRSFNQKLKARSFQQNTNHSLAFKKDGVYPSPSDDNFGQSEGQKRSDDRLDSLPHATSVTKEKDKLCSFNDEEEVKEEEAASEGLLAWWKRPIDSQFLPLTVVVCCVFFIAAILGLVIDLAE